MSVQSLSQSAPVDIIEGLPVGDLLLVCSDGIVIRVHSQILSIASGVLRNTTSKTLKVEGPSSSWRVVLQQIYPLHPRPELSFQLVKSSLKIAHAYDMTSLLTYMLQFLDKHFPGELSPDPGDPGYVMSWLALADTLQLVSLRDMCLQKIRSLAFSGTLEDTILQRVDPSPSGSGTGTWGNVHRPRSRSKSNSDSGKQESDGQGDQETWYLDDKPELHDSLRELSRSSLEELLASLAMAASSRFQNNRRQTSEKAPF